MAVSGTQAYYNYNGGGYVSSYQPFNYLWLCCDYTESEIDTANNKSTIKVTVKLHHDTISIGARTVKLFWNGTEVKSFTGNSLWKGTSGSVTDVLGEGSFEVAHEDDGSAKGVLTCEWYPNMTYDGL